MTLPTGTYELGPQTAELTVLTTREGLAAKVGHDLTITFASWSGVLTLPTDHVADAGLEVTAELASIRVLDGRGGAMPLTDRDRGEITRTALRLLESDRYPQARFVATAVRGDAGAGQVEGTLTVRDASTPVTLAVAAGGGGWRASGTLRQSRLGIKPYKAFLGALKLADEVTVEVWVPHPGGA